MNDQDNHKDFDPRILRWRSRRGLLELELVLAPFVGKELDRLDLQDRITYAQLLAFDDIDIFEWIQGRGAPTDPALSALIVRIREANTPA